jgi:hypothetical protein
MVVRRYKGPVKCVSDWIRAYANPATPSPTSTPTSTCTTVPTAPSATPTLTPSIPTPPPYACTATDNRVCLSPSDSPVLKIAHTIYGEGATYSTDIAANIIQTVINRAYRYWEYTHHAGINPLSIPWEQIDRETLTNLLLYILSEPGGKGWPAYNAWRSPEPHNGIYWQSTIVAIEAILNNAGESPSTAVKVNGRIPANAIRLDTNVMFYGATNDPTWKPPKSVVYTDKVLDFNGNICIWQYYGTETINPPDAELNCPRK